MDLQTNRSVTKNLDRCHSDLCFPGICVSETNITRDPCFQEHTYIPSALN